MRIGTPAYLVITRPINRLIRKTLSVLAGSDQGNLRSNRNGCKLLIEMRFHARCYCSLTVTASSGRATLNVRVE